MISVQERSGLVVSCERSGPCITLVLDLSPGAIWPEPGQFYMLTPPTVHAYFPRPLSVMRFHRDDETAEFLFSVVGEGTRHLAEMRAGERLTLLGPLGRPYRFAPDATHVLVGGGRGIAPLVEVAWRAAERDLPVVWLAGARTTEWLFSPTDLPVERRVFSTDDGSAGEKGFVTDFLRRELDRIDGRVQVMTCGPNVMLERVAEICREHGVACQVSLEGPMACGLGLCRGCPIPVRTQDAPDPIPAYDASRPTPDGIHYQMCCQDGPVFDAEEVLWEWLR